MNTNAHNKIANKNIITNYITLHENIVTKKLIKAHSECEQNYNKPKKNSGM